MSVTNDLLTTALAAVFCLAIAAGCWLIASLGVGLVVAGLLGCVWTVLFIRDVPGQEKPKR